MGVWLLLKQFKAIFESTQRLDVTLKYAGGWIILLWHPGCYLSKRQFEQSSGSATKSKKHNHWTLFLLIYLPWRALSSSTTSLDHATRLPCDWRKWANPSVPLFTSNKQYLLLLNESFVPDIWVGHRQKHTRIKIHRN